MDAPADCTLGQRTEISRAFDAGNYAGNVSGHQLRTGTLRRMPEHERYAFVLGYFSAYSLHEIPGGWRALYDAAYRSTTGRYVVEVAKYTEDRADEYAAEESES